MGSVLRSRVARRRPPVLLHAITEACNARCPYCVFRHGKRRPDELSVDEIESVYRDAHANGIRYLHMWGGEPLVHPQLDRIGAIAKDVGLVTGLVTNGFLLDKRCDKVMPHIDRLYVSLDHPTSKHDDYRRTPGLFDAPIRGIRRVKAEHPNCMVMVSYVLFRDNADAMREMAELCEELGARLWINPMRSEANGDEPVAGERNDTALTTTNDDLCIPWPEQGPLWESLIEMRKAGLPVHNSYFYMRQIVKTGQPPSYRCHWPKLALTLDANGDVVDCQRWGKPIVNVRDAPLADILRMPRLDELRGTQGESCNLCTSPSRVEPSAIWDFHPGMIGSGLLQFGPW